MNTAESRGAWIRLDGEVAAVTGAANGIGRACAVKLALAGASVALLGRDVASLSGSIGAIRDAGGVALPYAADLAEEDSVVRAFADIRDQLGPVDMLVNNAGGSSGARQGEFYAKALPNKVNYGSVGVATSTHVVMEQLNQLLGLQMQHVPYNGSGPGIQALLKEEVHIAVHSSTAVQPYVTSGDLVVLANASPARTLPDLQIPTVNEELKVDDFVYRPGTRSSCLRRRPGRASSTCRRRSTRHLPNRTSRPG